MPYEIKLSEAVLKEIPDIQMPIIDDSGKTVRLKGSDSVTVSKVSNSIVHDWRYSVIEVGKKTPKEEKKEAKP